MDRDNLQSASSTINSRKWKQVEGQPCKMVRIGYLGTAQGKDIKLMSRLCWYTVMGGATAVADFGNGIQKIIL